LVVTHKTAGLVNNLVVLRIENAWTILQLFTFWWMFIS